MTKDDFEKIQFNADIYAKDLKDGMKIIDEDDCDKPDAISYVFDVSEVVVTKEKVTFREIAYGKNKQIIYDFIHEIFREPEEPMLTVFFSSVEEGKKFGIAKDKIQTTRGGCEYVVRS